jgi:structural maintenance of chromosome 2
VEINSLKAKVEGVEYRHRLNFQYNDPEPNFDRRKVRGRAAKLFSVKEERFCQALTTAGGGKLYNVVTDDEIVSKALIKRGGVKSAQAYIPLNKINPYVLNQRKIAAAKRIGGNNNVWWAKELIEYDNDVDRAMNYLYGGVLICRDLKIANEVAFHGEVMTSCITLDGDKISPGGDMSGGTRAQTASVLLDLFHFRETEVELNRKQRQLVEIEQQLRRVAGVAEQWNTLSQQFELRQHELDMIRNRLKQTLHHQLQEEVERLIEATKEVNDGVARAKTTLKDGANHAAIS